MSRRALGVVLTLGVLGAGFWGVRAVKRAAAGEVLAALERLDCTPERESWAWATLSLYNVRCPGVQVGALVLDAPSRSATFETVIVDVAALPWPRLRDMAKHREDADAIAESGQEPGRVSTHDGLLRVGCGESSSLAIEEVQPEGKKRMAASDFVRGYRPEEGELLGERK